MPSFAPVLLVSIRTVPEKEFAPLKISVPGPVLAKPFPLTNGNPSVAEFWLTTMEGCVAEEVSSVRTLPASESNVQLCVPEASPNFNVPMLRLVSSVTIRLAVTSMALKSAVKPAPLASSPSFQRFVELYPATVTTISRACAGV